MPCPQRERGARGRPFLCAAEAVRSAMRSEVHLHTEETGSGVAVVGVDAALELGVLQGADQVHTRSEGVAGAELVDVGARGTGRALVALLPGRAEGRTKGEAVDGVGQTGGDLVPLQT